MHIFYQPDIEYSKQLSADESKHATKVLRLKTSDRILVYDGNGGKFTCEIGQMEKKTIKLEILEKKMIQSVRNYTLHIAICPTKNINRFEWFLEKATEIGIDQITPIICEHSERKNINTDRLERILVAAMKQSKNPFLPRLNPLIHFNEFLHQSGDHEKFIAHCNSNALPSLKSLYQENENVELLIGPEGDFSANEVQKAMKYGYREINLGDARLRTETAGVVACHSINFMNQS